MKNERNIFFYFQILYIILGLIQCAPVSGEDLTAQGEAKLREIHSRYTQVYGDRECELPEQIMSALFISPDAKVLELGSDVGRNTCVIAAILNDSSNLVTMECREEPIPYLTANRDYNNFKFHIEPSALSEVPLIQKGWMTIPSDVDLPGYTRVPTITLKELKRKYKIKFDTLVVDCEGALYYILKDTPNLLKNIKLVIIENDFSDSEHYQFVANLFIKNGLQVVYTQSVGGGAPCHDYFYQVWKKP